VLGSLGFFMESSFMSRGSLPPASRRSLCVIGWEEQLASRAMRGLRGSVPRSP
jgi:hypothetical protein